MNMPARRKLQIIPLGGALEIGKNMTAFEADGSIILIDACFALLYMKLDL